MHVELLHSPAVDLEAKVDCQAGCERLASSKKCAGIGKCTLSRVNGDGSGLIRALSLASED